MLREKYYVDEDEHGIALRKFTNSCAMGNSNKKDLNNNEPFGLSYSAKYQGRQGIAEKSRIFWRLDA